MKYILLFVGVSLIALIVFTFTLPGNMTVSSQKIINVPSGKIEEHIIDLKKWEEWNNWKKIDSTIEISFGEKDSGVGAKIYWGHEGKKENEIVIKNYEPNKTIDFDLIWNEGNEISPGKFSFKNRADTATVVSLTHTKDLGNNPLKRLLSAFSQDVFKEQFDIMLSNLKKVAER